MLTKEQFTIVFLFQNKSHYDRAVRAASSTEQNEDYDFCVARERGEEIAVCLANGIEHVILFEDNNFDTDYSFTSKEVLLRGSILLVSSFKNQLRYSNLKYVIEGSVLKWPKKIVKHMVKRNVSIVQHKDTLNGYTFPIFIKTLGLQNKKSKSHFIIKNSEEYLNDYSMATMHFSEEYPMIVSDYMEIKEDEMGKKEYRCWVSNQKVSSISRYNDYITNYTVSREIVDYAMDFVTAHKHLPSCYVLDIAETDHGIDIVELNDLEASGRYGKNGFDKFLQFIVRL